MRIGPASRFAFQAAIFASTTRVTARNSSISTFPLPFRQFAMAVSTENQVTGSSNAHKVVVAGCSYGGLSLVMNLLAQIDNTTFGAGAAPDPKQTGVLEKPVEITIIDPRDGIFHLVGTPLAHTTQSFVYPFWRQYKSIKHLQRPGLKICRGLVKDVDPAAQLVTYEDAEDAGKTYQVRYDRFVLASGMIRSWPSAPRQTLKKAYVQDATNMVNNITRVPGGHIVVIGGGAVGIEIAAEITHNHPSQVVTLVHSRKELLSNEPLPSEFKEKALDLLKEENVNVILNQRATVTTDAEAGPNGPSTVTLTNGDKIVAHHVIYATSKNVPNTGFVPSAAVNEEGFVKITPELRFAGDIPNAKNHFAVGDIAASSAIRRAGGALWQGALASKNLYSDFLRAEGQEVDVEPSVYPDYPPVMGLAVGAQMVGWTKETGLRWGHEMMQQGFGDDLGWKNTLKHIGLDPEDESQDKPLVTVA